MKLQKETKLEKKLAVLLIESTVEQRTFFAAAIRSSEKFSVITCGNFKDAFEILINDHENINFILFNWSSSGISGNIFAQKIRSNYKYDHIELITFAQNMSDEDAYLLSELDIHYKIPKIINGNQLIIKLEEIRSDYHLINPILKKINELKHYIHMENLEKCEEILKDEKILHKIKTNHKYLYLNGEILILREKYNEAINYFHELLKENHKMNNIETLKTLSTMGKAYCLAGRHKVALMIFQKLEAKSPKNLNHKLMTGDAYLGLEESYEAETKYHEVLDKSPKHKGALTGMVKANAIAGKFDVAKSFFDQIEGEFESRSLASYFNNRGVILIKENKVTEAIAFYKNALPFFKKYRGQIHFNIGMAFARCNKMNEAAKYFNEALNSDGSEFIEDKTLIKIFKEYGVEKFIENFKILNPIAMENLNRDECENGFQTSGFDAKKD